MEAQVKLDHCFEDTNSDDQACGVIQEIAADKGYHANEVLKSCNDLGIRTYIPEREGDGRRWSDKETGMKAAFHGNRQRMQRSKGKNLQKRRSEVVERGFAHVCETGGARRTWLRGLEKVRKRHLISVAAHNLGIVMRHLFGFSKPRALSAASGLLILSCLAMVVRTAASRLSSAARRFQNALIPPSPKCGGFKNTARPNVVFSTGC